MNNWALSGNLGCWRPSLSKNGWLKGADYAEISNAYTPASQSHRPIILFLPCPNAYACLLTFVASVKPRIKLLLRLRLICVPMMSISVRVVTETHLKRAQPDAILNIANYSTFRRDRNWSRRDMRNNDGVAIYIRNNLTVVNVYRSTLYEVICRNLRFSPGHRSIACGM